MPGGMRLTSSPLGPFTRTDSASARTSTPFGIVTGAFPTRDTMDSPSLPDVGQDLAADARRARLLAGRDPLRRRHDGHAQAPQDLGHLLGRGVDAPPRLRDPG